MSLADAASYWADCEPERIALVCGAESTSWRRFANRIERASARLAGEWGVVPGEVVAYLGQNSPDELILLFALSRLGAVFLPLNYRLACAEWRTILADAGARLVLVDAALAAAAAPLAESGLGCELRPVEALIAMPCPAGAPRATLPDSAPQLLVYTSGTTGQPKGVVHSRAALVWNALASHAAHDLSSADHVLTGLPLFHVGGLCIQTLPALLAGASVTLLPRFEAGAWLQAVARGRPTLSLMVPATLAAVLAHDDFGATDLTSLRALMAGSSTIPLPLIEAFHARDIPVGQVYGATETGPVSIVLRPAQARAKVGRAGWPALFSRVRLVDAAGQDVERGAVGEIWVSGPNLATGYWRAGTGDAAHGAALADGWFRSGDLARQDADGCYEVVGRAKDMIISGGENIYPAELENILALHPDIAEAAVVGVADARWGEAPVAAVVARDGRALDALAILGVFEGQLARFKHPRQVVFLDALPKNAMGKVQRAELAALVVARLPASRPA